MRGVTVPVTRVFLTSMYICCWNDNKTENGASPTAAE
jgi:hypothetical protein